MRKRLIAATIALAIAFTLGCEEKESSKPAAAAEAADSLTSAAKPAEEVSSPADIAASSSSDVSCSVENVKKTIYCKEGEKVKLLESITDKCGKVEKKFEYDNQNRIVKILDYDDTTKITYGADGSVAVKKDGDVKKYVKKGNTITAGEETFTIDKDGYFVKDTEAKCEYKDGNLIGIDWLESGYGSLYSYDDKKSPFSSTNTPKWLIQRLSNYNYESASENNVVENEGESGISKYKYEYDSDGFPTKQEIKSCDRGCVECDKECSTSTIHYTYLCH